MPTGAQIALAVAGPVAHAVSWGVVRWGRVSVVSASSVTMAVLGPLAVIVGPIAWADRFDVLPAAGIGIAAGVALYLATVAFMAVAGRVDVVARHTADLYREAEDRPAFVVLALSVLVSAPGEELLWRGVVLSVLEDSAGSVGLAALLCWAAFAAVNAVSGRIPIILGGLVGGAAWTGLAWWTGGVAASIACHAVWTGLMILRPPPGAEP
jgi:membrane protease YdiL (CAAX protease family)